MNSLIIFFITITSLLIGYLIGKNNRVEIPTVSEVIKKVKMSQVKPGPIMRPSIKQIDRRENKVLYEGIDEVKKAFDELGVKNG